MSYKEAINLLDRVRAGDQTPTRAEIIRALTLTGDLA